MRAIFPLDPEKLEHERHLRFLSVPDLARKAGCSSGYMHDLEKGRKQPSLDMARRIAEALGVSAKQIIRTPSASLKATA